jgi:hypothetical protein
MIPIAELQQLLTAYRFADQVFCKHGSKGKGADRDCHSLRGQLFVSFSDCDSDLVSA